MDNPEKRKKIFPCPSRLQWMLVKNMEHSNVYWGHYYFFFLLLKKKKKKTAQEMSPFSWYSTLIVGQAQANTRHAKCTTGLCTHTCLPTRMHPDKAGETQTTVRGDNISFSRGVTSISAGRGGGSGLCLCWPSGPAALRCEQIAGRRAAHWHILMVWFNTGGDCKLGISLLHIGPVSLDYTPPTWLRLPFTRSLR